MTGHQLNSVSVFPQSLLDHLGQLLDIAVPDIASVRTLYRRERTLYEHQIFASDLLRFRSLTTHAERGLIAHLRKEAATVSSPQELLTSAHRWLYEHRYFIPRRRRIQDRIRQSVRHTEQQFLQSIDHEAPAATRKRWIQALLSSSPDKGDSLAWEWLRAALGRKSKNQFTDGLDKLHFLQFLGIDKIPLAGISMARLRHYAQCMARRNASQLNKQREPRRSLELVCFLRFTLLQATDAVLGLIDQHIVGLWRVARQRAESQAVHDLLAYRNLVNQLWDTAADSHLAQEQLREKMVALLRPFRKSRHVSRTAAIRDQMTAHKTKLRALLSAIIDLPFTMAPDHPLATALAILRELYGSRTVELPMTVESPFAACWTSLIADTDRKHAVRV